jgi:hypothetical protein
LSEYLLSHAVSSYFLAELPRAAKVAPNATSIFSDLIASVFSEMVMRRVNRSTKSDRIELDKEVKLKAFVISKLEIENLMRFDEWKERVVDRIGITSVFCLSLAMSSTRESFV